ncbi:MAG TPA: hypothetical protein VGI81_14325 [Tepidisphaeraceae bacterium]|jgi:hypothetical protein
MAKAKKQTEIPAAETSEATPAREPAAKKAPAAKKSTKTTASAAPAAPLIDTSLAAAAAAKMVANRDLLNAAGEKRQSGAFKQLKESLTKPAASGPASFLQSTAPQKKSNLPFGGRNQVGHNQTFGADVNRAGVPRRTGG